MLANTKQIRTIIKQAIAQNNGCLLNSYTDAPVLCKPFATRKRYVSFAMINSRETSLAILATAQKLAKQAGYTNPIRCVSRNIRAVATLA